MPYARGTTVPIEKSRMEIERIVKQHGATAFTYGRPLALPGPDDPVDADFEEVK